MIRTRIAPSPTGIIHIGTAYMSLFNWAFAKKNGGKFILRLEDTDVKRHVKNAEEEIYKGLSWLGISWDEGPDKPGPYGPYKQSQRQQIYHKKAKELVDKGFAYEDEGAVRFKNPGDDIWWDDLVRGKISFSGAEITDFVLVRSDGMALYNFAVVVDDMLMQISHVIRGEEHISNTPRQLALYRAFGKESPKLAHIPLLRNPDRSKISKRANPVSLNWYKDEGYLKESILNFLALMGWTHPGGKEIFAVAEFVEKFDVNHSHKTAPIFDINKLDWLNGEYIRKTQNSELKTQIYDFFKGEYPKEKIEKILPLIKDRIKTLKEFESIAGFFFKEPRVDKKLFGASHKVHLAAALKALEKGISLDEVPQKEGFKVGDFFMDLRVAVSGTKITPPINESIEILGKEEAIKRIREVL